MRADAAEKPRDVGGARLARAVRALAYSDDYNLLVSGSYAPVAHCWDPTVRGRIGLEMRLVGHRAPLASVVVAKLARRGVEWGN